VLRHDHIAEDDKPLSPAHLLQSPFEEILVFLGRQVREPVKAAESDEVVVARVLIADQS
jgi:hypothetical protein